MTLACFLAIIELVVTLRLLRLIKFMITMAIESVTCNARVASHERGQTPLIEVRVIHLMGPGTGLLDPIFLFDILEELLM